MDAQNAGLKALLGALDVEYARRLAVRMEEYRSNPVLGYRPGGSQAEFQTGEMLAEEMRALGLTVFKEPFRLDGWEFQKARLTYQGADGLSHTAELGGYQTDLQTGGPKEITVVNAGKGTARELDKLDVRGKACLIAINQREDWWINYPAYQAHLRGALAVIAAQRQGYGEVNAGALNAQDICGPRDAPALSISRRDMKEMNLRFGEEKRAVLDADSRVLPDTVSYNILGVMEGKAKDRYMLLSAHYDSYFSGFQDDNTAVALMLAIARAARDCGWKPNHTLLFCAMGAEEWGVSDSQYDWSRGAYCQITKNRPEWRGRCFLNINLELPAHAHGKKHYIRSVYEYRDFLKRQLKALPKELKAVYPKGSGVLCPTQTWSDDFSMAVNGVPALVNEFGSGAFIQTHYHSQFDTEDAYDEKVYWYHHMLYARLLYAADQTAVPPMSFVPRLRALEESLTCQHLPAGCEGAFRQAADKAVKKAAKLQKRVSAVNRGDVPAPPGLSRALLAVFQEAEDYLVRLTWDNESVFPHEPAQRNFQALHKAQWQLAVKDLKGALSSLCLVDNNRYAAAFDREVTDYFTKGALHQPTDRLQWGAGRVMGHMDLYDPIQELKALSLMERPDPGPLMETLREKEKEALAALISSVKAETKFLKSMQKRLEEAAGLFP